MSEAPHSACQSMVWWLPSALCRKRSQHPPCSPCGAGSKEEQLMARKDFRIFELQTFNLTVDDPEPLGGWRGEEGTWRPGRGGCPTWREAGFSERRRFFGG